MVDRRQSMTGDDSEEDDRRWACVSRNAVQTSSQVATTLMITSGFVSFALSVLYLRAVLKKVNKYSQNAEERTYLPLVKTFNGKSTNRKLI